MGLLDFNDDEDDFAFPNFDSSFSPPPKSSVTDKRKSPLNSTLGCSLESVSTTESSSTRSAPPSPLDAPIKPIPKASSRQTKSKRPKPQKSRSLPKPTTSFDLYGDDEELQEAEPKIGFCEACLKHCQIHDTPVIDIAVT